MTLTDPAAIHSAFADAVNAGDLDGLVSLFHEQAVVVERTGSRTSGTAAIRRHLEELVALEPKMRIEATFAFPNGDVALLCSRWTAVATAPDGHEVTLDFRGSEVACRDANGSWRLFIDDPWGVDISG
jgi:uncharacterized protein (TIGR02246 family)